MKIEYSVTEEDFMAYGRIMITSPASYKNGRWLAKFFTIFIGIACFTLLSDILKGVSNASRWTVQAIVFFVVLWSLVTSNRREKRRVENYLRSLAKKKNTFCILGDVTIELLEDTLSVSLEGMEAVYQMSRIQEIVECPEHILIKLGPSTEIIPRKNIKNGNLLDFVNALKLKGVPSSEMKDEERDRIQPGIYVFIAAAVAAIPTWLGYSSSSDVKLLRFFKCLGDFKIASTDLCVSILGVNEALFLCACTVFGIFLITSIWMFYKNSKKVATCAG